MAHLHDLTEEFEQRLIARWAATVVEQGVRELDDGIHGRVAGFLAELRVALRRAVDENAPSLAGEPSAHVAPPAVPAAGARDVRVVVRAFAALERLLLELASTHGITVSAAEQMTLASHISVAVIAAADDQSRESVERGYRTAHQLRNPLGSAMMAVTLLRGKVDFGPHARLIDTLERNLKRLETLINEAAPTPGAPQQIAGESR
jgi:signal transduction histidine kinase